MASNKDIIRATYEASPEQKRECLRAALEFPTKWTPVRRQKMR